MGIKSLVNAKNNVNDEFYTFLSDIEKELWNYNKFFKGKVIFCNCDDPYESNFFKYFAMNFNFLGLKKLIATCYNNSPIVENEISIFDYLNKKHENNKKNEKKAFKIVINEVKDYNKDNAIDLFDVQWLIKNKKNVISELKGNGDFRSNECIELLKKSDIVVTNPPFSLFPDFIEVLMKYKKKFVIIADLMKLGYATVFPYIKDNKIWLGYNSVRSFIVPKNNKHKGCIINENGDKIKKFGNMIWLTNLQVKKRADRLNPIKKYNAKDYPKYDNYDVIRVDKVENIPFDYDGLMGLPLSFLTKHNPKEFEIVACSQTGCHPDEMRTKVYNDYIGYHQNGKKTGRNGSTCGHNAMLKQNDGKHDYYKNSKGVVVQSDSPRIFIRKI